MRKEQPRLEMRPLGLAVAQPCHLLTTPWLLVAQPHADPGYAGDLSVQGLLMVQEHASEMLIEGTLSGLPASAEAGWHIHTGYTCSDAAGVGGHFYDTAGSDPWNAITYTSDSNGVAAVSVTMSGFSMNALDALPVFGRAVVVHGGGARAGCGTIGGAFGVSSAIAQTVPYAGYTYSEQYAVKAMATLSEASGTLVMKAHLSGLERGGVGGIHIHEGFGCTRSSGSLDRYAGGHYYDGLSVDPWTTTYTADSQGVAHVELSLPDFSLEGVRPVAGRVIVVHLSATYGGARAACGVIVPSNAEVAEVGTYPDFAGSAAVRGMIAVHSTLSGTRYEGVLTGLEVGVSGGWHVHSGFSCGSSYGVGGHYFEGLGSDPWVSTSYTADNRGVAWVDTPMSDFTLHRTRPVYGRTVVVHLSQNSGSARAGCGVIGAMARAYPAAVSSFKAYPGYGGEYMVKGTLSVSSVPGSSSVRIHGILAGLEPSVTAGFHIHEGFGCSATAGNLDVYAGGHFWPGLERDTWLDVGYTTDSDGVAVVDVTVADFTVQPGQARSVAGRTVVVHLSSASGSARVACGQIAPYGIGEADVVHVGRYPGYTGSVDTGYTGVHDVRGMVLERPTSTGVDFSGMLLGLDTSATGGWHVHTGYVCAPMIQPHTAHVCMFAPCSLVSLSRAHHGLCRAVLPTMLLLASLTSLR